jgi:uncharacterized protein YwqG
MDPEKIDSLPLEFQPYHEQLAATIRPHIQITAKPGKTQLLQSKILGLPYLPRDQTYPKDIDGHPMLLLAQLNFSEIPTIPDYPDQGILQFFISTNDDTFGANLESFESMQAQSRFQVRYFGSIVAEPEQIHDFEFLRPEFADAALRSPAEWECELSFEQKEGIVCLEDYRFEQCLGAHFFERFGANQAEVQETYWQTFSSQGHRIGGYAFFPNTDPRIAAPEEDWLLLLQIDTDSEAGIFWGDVGVGSFFIPRANLLRRDFSKVLYTWDCS